MKKIVSLLVLLMVGVTNTISAQKVASAASTVSGTLLDCVNGKVFGVRGIDVYIYGLPAAERLYAELKKTELLRNRANDGGAAEFFEAYDRLEKIVRSGKFSGRHLISNGQGRFSVNRLSPSRDYLILAMSLKVEDDSSYYSL